MEIWLSKEMDRRKALLYILLFSKNSISLSRLSTLLQVDKKTIYTDIEYINETWSSIIFISFEENTINMVESPNSNIQTIFMDMVNSSVYFNALEAILLKKVSSINELSSQMFLSTSTVRRIIRQINKNLHTRKLSINLKQLRLEGADLSKQIFLIYFMIEKYGFLNWPFHSINQNNLLFIITRCSELFDIKLSERFKSILAYFIAISLHLYEEVSFTNNATQCFLKKYDTFVRNTLWDNLEVNYQSEHIINELTFLLLSIFSRFYEISKFEENNITIKNFIAKIEAALGVTLDNDSFIKLNYVFSYVHFTHLIYPYQKFLVYDRKHYNSFPLKYYFPTFTKVVENGLHQLELENDIPWYTQYKHLLLHDIFIVWDRLPEKMLLHRKPVSIAIITPLDSDYLNTICFFVEKTIGDISTMIISKSNVSHSTLKSISEQLDSVQIIITNQSISEFEDKQFLVNYIPDEKQLSQLKKTVTKLWYDSYAV